jgi:hypothetical protein
VVELVEAKGAATEQERSGAMVLTGSTLVV